MHKNTDQYHNIFQVWDKMIIKQDKKSQLRVSHCWSLGELVFNMNIYIYIVLFGLVKLEFFHQDKKKTFNSEHLNFPGKELNVTDIKEQ